MGLIKFVKNKRIKRENAYTIRMTKKMIKTLINRTLLVCLLLSLNFGLLTTISAVGEIPYTVVIDAGHGGMDGGVTGRRTGIKESDVNLSLSKALCSSLSEFGFNVTMTRETTSGICGEDGTWYKKEDMQKRKEIIQKTNPTFVLSVHQNFYPASELTRGGQVFYLRGNEDGKRLAQSLQQALNEFYGELGAKPREAMAADYYLLSCVESPAVIVECGFLSNPQDEQILASSNGRKRIAQVITKGIAAYCGLNEESRG